jgi:RNA polymerase sigma-70 factor (ECF subfamily)
MVVKQAMLGRALGRSDADELDWDALYAEQLPRIFNYFRFRLGRRADIEELTSRTFEKAWRGRARYKRDRAGFSTWLFAIAQNVGTDFLRSQRAHVAIDEALDTAGEETPQGNIERESDRARLAALTARLPPRERELIALKYGAAINNRLIAQLTGLTESNVGTILQRTVEKLRSQWYRKEPCDE